ncbi:DUF445 family protein [Rhodococcus kroppenstedtii]|uniref:DUF445 family protein n=1 Tax=Rhodococcoides kroppenstedtii TaxID=293050 RepID=A0A1I0T7Y7_9NOCA|nr:MULTISPECIES: DUF445 family protein [Rhodococcus]AMY17632.1 hypothetical protein A3Q40_00217 [Rhodococcus sp. PBTS 1]MBT1191061.1 DUF445 family protein [Rhodococcus kroppenstedtii]MBY6314200.1 DUF445 family protein [Rhodococcus kroppenstedtii]MBY6321973.1 DUF445 family protein [Rhodococcus kroppenstedtii]MBY6400519.1 DUF445 family protein [Rhodococcus kroppenstedtii]
MSFDEDVKRRDLRRMKGVATGFLVFATVVYLYCRWQESRGAGDWVGYVRAASEAGMVGALADWFAVTALFRHPLALPIPHTAIIKRKKDQLGASLGSFVGTNFLAVDVVTQKVQAARVPLRLGTWLAEKKNAERVAEETATVLRGVLDVLDDEDIQQVIDNTIVKRLGDPQWGPPIGRVLASLLEENRQKPLVDLLAERAHEWAQNSLPTIDRIVSRDSPSWSPKFVDVLLGERIHRELVDFTWKVRSNPQHELRLAADKFLVDFANDLQHDPETIAKAESIKSEIMGRDEVTGLAAASWKVAKRLIVDSVDDPNSTLRATIAQNVQKFGLRLRDDTAVREKADGWLLAGVRYIVENYTDEITTVITDTVARWDADEASRKIELQVGRDLQFIRINGTVVGSLAGLAIYTASDLLFGH